MFKRKIILFLFIAQVFALTIYSQSITLLSPDKNINISINIKEKIYYSVAINNGVVMKDNSTALAINNTLLGDNAKLQKKTTSTINETIKPVVPLKNSTVANNCNVLKLDFKGNYSVEFRAYNDGVAYRFITAIKDSINVVDEEALLHFNDNTEAVWSETSSFKTAYEIQYKRKKLAEISEKNMSTLPVSFNDGKHKVLVSEADLYDYPGMFLKSNGNGIKAVFPKQPIAFGDDGDRSVKIEKEASYIAKTNGKRSFPWRFFLITSKDEQIIDNDMVLKLSSPPVSQDFSWVKPGQVTWEWWHDALVYGVDFKSGYNQETYKYYIDFASAHGITYILMDEGWAKTTLNPFEPNPTINLKELIAYGKSKNVNIILWFTWLAVEQNFNVFKTLHDWGIAGMKIDFMDRSDQWMVNYYERVAAEAAKNNIIVDFHGAFKPAGLQKKYPNVLSFEGVVGMEQNIWSGYATTDNNVFLPFLRNAVGPMDYTPGAMYSAHPKEFHGSRVNEMSIGTRAHQLSLYVVFESGLQMLADNPYNYLREKESLDFITSVPVTWDETNCLLASEGEFVITAKRKGSKWFIGGIANSKGKEATVATDFLEKGKQYNITIIQDGVNADRQAMDYKKITKKINGGDKLEINMVADGGYVATIEAIN